MSDSFYCAFQNAAYPCYWMSSEGEFWANSAASQAPAQTKEVEKSLQKRLAEKDSPALIMEAFHIQGLHILPLENGLFASLPEGPPANAAASAFSMQAREPLSNIFAVLPLITKNLEDEELIYAEEIQRNCYSLLRLACNLESCNKAAQQRFEPKLVDLDGLVYSLTTCVESVCREQGVPLRKKLPGAPLPVLGDVVLLNEAILNVLRNALQYTRDGNEISIRLYEAGGRAVLRIEDQGLGIQPESLEHILEPYFSRDPYGDSGFAPGLGLGLAVTQQVIQSFGGTITVESRFGEGTAITLALPLHRDADGSMLSSDPADYLLNRYSSIYIQLSGYCRLPVL